MKQLFPMKYTMKCHVNGNSYTTPGTRALTEKEGRTGQQNRLHETAEELIIGTARKGPF